MVEYKIPVTIFINLSKAFDTLIHVNSLHELKLYGVLWIEHKLLTSYLPDGKQYVLFNGLKSETTRICIGDLQGSILGQLLFCIYINDLVCMSRKLKIPYVC